MNVRVYADTEAIGTAGATLFAATDVLLAAGAQQVRCLTFARVWG